MQQQEKMDPASSSAPAVPVAPAMAPSSSLPVTVAGESSSSKAKEGGGAVDEQIRNHRTRLQFVNAQVQQTGVIVAMISFTYAVLYFTLGVHPYRFIIYATFTLPFNTNNFTLVYFALSGRKRNKKPSSRDAHLASGSKKKVVQDGSKDTAEAEVTNKDLTKNDAIVVSDTTEVTSGRLE